MSYSAATIAQEIPALRQAQGLLYLDNAATALLPDIVACATAEYIQDIHAPVYRATYARAEHATLLYEQSRSCIADYLHAMPDEIVFTSGATAAVDIISRSLVQPLLRPGDEIILSEAEHHSHMLVWMHVARQTGACIVWVPAASNGLLDVQAVIERFTPRTRFLLATVASHVTGIYQDENWNQIISAAQARGIVVIADASQLIGHRPLSLPYAQSDVLFCSAHKMMGPPGIGVLRIKKALHPLLQPALYGGGMVQEVALNPEKLVWQPMPHLLEAGTPLSLQAYVWAKVIAWQKDLWKLDDQQLHEAELIAATTNALRTLPGVHVLMPSDLLLCHFTYSHLVSFFHERIHAHDIAYLLGQENICVRAGTLCAQPYMKALAVPAVVRISVHAYTTFQEIESFMVALKALLKTL